MKYLSVCSGIEAATVAWHHMGWKPVGFSEIEPFPCKLLAHHYPHVKNFGDMTKFKEWEIEQPDVLVGGTPCQSFSIAGLRKGLDDPRGNLMLTYVAIASRFKPKWLAWENVPGVLSSNGGKDFASLITALEECGYGVAYRVLDAQYIRTHQFPRAVPHRRRRVFVVGHLGDWRRAAAVLFDSESMCGSPAPSRKKREAVAGTIGARTGLSRGVQDCESGHIIQSVAPTLQDNYADKYGLDNQHINSGGGCSSVAKCLVTKTRLDSETETLISINGGRFVDAIALAGNTIGRQPENGGNGTGFDDTGSSYTLTKTDAHAVCFATAEVGPCMGSSGPPYSRTGNERVESDALLIQSMQVRRLTPTECERLQGFPDGYTDIPSATDSSPYKALGNSMAVNVMQWIGERIYFVDQIK